MDDTKAVVIEDGVLGGARRVVVIDDEDRPRLSRTHALPEQAAYRGAVKPTGLRSAQEVVPKLGAKPGYPALRMGDVAAYDRPIEHLAGQLDVLPVGVPIRKPDDRYGLVLCFALEECELDRLAAELVRVTNPDGSVWVVVWKKDHLPAGAPSWDDAQETVLRTGWVDNKILSLGDQIYATRYVRRRRPGKAARAAPSGRR